MTTTTVAEVVLLDDSNYEKTLRLDNPKDNLTLAEVRAAFATPISEKWFYGRSSLVVSVARVNIVTTTKTSLE